MAAHAPPAIGAIIRYDGGIYQIRALYEWPTGVLELVKLLDADYWLGTDADYDNAGKIEFGNITMIEPCESITAQERDGLLIELECVNDELDWCDIYDADPREFLELRERINAALALPTA